MRSYALWIGIIAALILTLNGCGGGGSGGGNTDSTAPNFTSPNTVSVNEKQVNVLTVHADDTTTISYSIGGGDDGSKFSIGSNLGTLTFKVAPDYDSPEDSNRDNHYQVTVTATDTSNNQAQQQITVTVVAIDVTAPNFTSNNTITMKENHVFAGTVHANDDSAVTYSIAGGDDSSKFTIYSHSGKLRFMTGPDFEHPINNNANNTYELTVKATDSADNWSQQQISVTVTDIDEASSDDFDDDMIPDNIEILIESNVSDHDANNNGVDDGLDTNGTYGDTFFDKQWHIRSLGTATNNSGVETIFGNDLNITGLYHHYMGYNYGENIIVQVVDTGVDADHEDLAENMDLSRSYDGSNIGDPSANTANNTHGTMVAGIMAARAFNGKGVRGIIPFAKIAGSNWLKTQGTYELEKVWLTDGIAITNNSWGMDFNDDTTYEDIMQEGTSTLRGGKGKIYVFAAGNARTKNKNANLQYPLSNRYMIAVAALKNDNTHADYSTPGSNILVSGYSGNYYYDSPTIGTTTIMGASSGSKTWEGDSSGNYTFAMNGTSAASPTVAASIALVLEACPTLTWRDIKNLVAKHATKVDITNSTWEENNAGLWHSIDYGFGLINAEGMINDCTQGYTLLSDEKNQNIIKTFNIEILNNSTQSFDITITDNFIIEWIEVTIDNDNLSAEDYEIKLRSPNGSSRTETILMTANTNESGNWMNGGFRFSTAAMIGEASQGTWTVDISDKINNSYTGTVKEIQLKIYGH